jgi:hypothetical protein
MTYRAIEKYNQKNIKLLLKQNVETLEDIINNGDRCKTGNEWYVGYIIKCLGHFSRNKGGCKITYKYGDKCNSGRQFAKPYGLQNLPRNIRNLLTEDMGLFDYDIKNAHFQILYNLCIKHSINCPILTTIVNDREKFLKSVDLNKYQLLVFLNMDKPYTNNNNILINLEKELDYIKNSIILLYPQEIDKKKKDNILSSKLNKVLCYFENEAVMKVIKHYSIKNASIIFDGFMTSIELNLDDLKTLTNLTWTIKTPEEFNLDDYLIENEYDVNKKLFEENNFITLNPLQYYSRISPNHDYFPISYDDFSKKSMIYNYLENKSFIKEWLEDEDKYTYDTAVFNPNPSTLLEREFNLFKPFAYNKIDDTANEDIQFFIDIVNNNAGNEEESFEYLMNYIAHIFQFPDENPQTCIVIKGLQGCGKDTLTHIIELLFGVKNNYLIKIADIDNIMGSFNEVLDKKLVVQINEMDSKNGSKFNNRIKDLITTEFNIINRKYQSVQTQKNYIRWFIFSNNLTPVVVEQTCRRFLIFNSGSNHRGDRQYWNDVYTKLKDKKVVASIYKYLINRDLSNYNPKVLVETKAKASMKMFSGCPTYKYLKIDFINQSLPTRVIKKVEYNYITCSILWKKFQKTDYFKDSPIKSVQFKRLLVNVDGIKIIKVKYDKDLPRKDCYVIEKDKAIAYLNEAVVLVEEEDDEGVEMTGCMLDEDSDDDDEVVSI